MPDITLQNLTSEAVHIGDLYTKVPAYKDNGPCEPNELGIINLFRSSSDLMNSPALHKAIAEGKIALGIAFTQDELDSDFCIFPGICVNVANFEVLDEGTSVASQVASINFVGSSVVATAVGNDVTVTVSGAGGGTRVYNESPVGDIDGVNTDYVVISPMLVGSEVVKRNGVDQVRGASSDYILVESVPASGDFDTVRMAIPLIPGTLHTEQIAVDYHPA